MRRRSQIKQCQLKIQTVKQTICLQPRAKHRREATRSDEEATGKADELLQLRGEKHLLQPRVPVPAPDQALNPGERSKERSSDGP